MKRLLIAMTGAAAALSAAPMIAHAQSVYDHSVDASAVVGGDWTLGQREDWVANRLRMAVNDDAIDTVQFGRLRDELDVVRDQEARMRASQDGELTDNQVARLEERLNGIADRMQAMRDEDATYPR